MRMINLLEYNILKGAFADILVDQCSNKVLKLFKSYDHPDLSGTGKEEIGEERTNTFRRKVYETEREAYEIVQGSNILIEYTPQYFGPVQIEFVKRGNIDVSHYYLTDCCFELEYIQGDCSKFCQLKSNVKDDERFYNELTSLENEFLRKGINYIIDSSIIINATNFKIIDFATIDPIGFEPILGDE